MGLLEELNKRYQVLGDEADALNARLAVIRTDMNEMISAIWALEAEADKSKNASDDGEAMRMAHSLVGDAKWRNEPKTAASLTPAPEAEPGSGHGEIATKLPPPDPFLTELMSKGGTWHDGGPNPAPDKFVDIYVPAASTSLGDRPNYLEGQPSNAYVWTGWEVAYRISEPAGEEKAADEPAGYQHVVDAEPAGGAREDADSPYVPFDQLGPDALRHMESIPGGMQEATGAKPALPDDTLVDLLYHGGWGIPNQRVGDVRWSDRTIAHWHLSPTVNYEPAPLIVADPSSVEELGEQSEPFSIREVEAEEAATSEQLQAAGVINPDAAFWARKLEGVS